MFATAGGIVHALAGGAGPPGDGGVGAGEAAFCALPGESSWCDFCCLESGAERSSAERLLPAEQTQGMCECEVESNGHTCRHKHVCTHVGR